MSEYNEVVASFNLEQLGDNRFRSRSPQLSWRRIYGGLLLAHGLRAAQLTVDQADRDPHSLHCYFLRPGDISAPLDLTVERLLDGRTINNRRVTVSQASKPVFSLQASFRKPIPGLSHQSSLPQAVPPEDLPDEKRLADMYASVLTPGAQHYLSREKVFELRPVDHKLFIHPDPEDPRSGLIWVRLRTDRLPDADMSWPLLAYLSDMTALNGSLHPHGRNFFDAGISMASLDHALWMHNRPDWSDWLLMSHEAMGNDAAMGLGRVSLFNRSGSLVASIGQQGFIRLKTPEK